MMMQNLFSLLNRRFWNDYNELHNTGDSILVCVCKKKPVELLETLNDIKDLGRVKLTDTHALADFWELYNTVLDIKVHCFDLDFFCDHWITGRVFF
jgi:hypothetical protein